MTQKTTTNVFFAFLLLIICTSCSTVIDVDIDRPAELDIKDARTIIVLPFKTSAEMKTPDEEKTYASEYFRKLEVISSTAKNQTEEQNIATILYDELTKKFSSSAHMELVSVDNARTATGSMNPIPADIVLSGGIRYYGTAVNSEERDMTEKNGNIERTTWYWRTIMLSIEYTIFDTKTNTSLETRERKYSLTSDETQTLAFVPTAESMSVSGIRYFVDNVYREFEPYVEKKELKLLFHKDTAMKAANESAQSNDLNTALRQYRALYAKRGFFEAGFNVGIILQAMGNYEEAENIMSELCEKFRDKRALEALRDIENERASAEKLQTQRKHD